MCEPSHAWRTAQVRVILPVVMMHLMNSRLTMMALSRASTAGGELAGAASSSRRSRA